MFECLFSETAKFRCSHVTTESKAGYRQAVKLSQYQRFSKCREATRYKTGGGNQTEFTMARMQVPLCANETYRK